MILCVVLLVATLLKSSAYDSFESASPSVEVFVPSTDGELRGIRFPILLIDTRHNRTGLADVVYLPKTGFAWTGGGLYKMQIAALEDRILGFCYESGGNQLIVSESTNRYESDLKDTSAMVQAEVNRYIAGPGRYAGDPSYFMRFEKLFGSAVLRDRVLPPMKWVDEINTLSVATRPSKLQGVTVEGSNAVVAVEFGTNMLAKIAFDKDVRPVWATTNGVSIGPIPTNTVHYIGVKPDGQRDIKVVY